MAGNKMNSKTKGKDDRNKGNKNGGQNEDPDDLDFSMLRKPILTSVTGFAQARKIFDLGTEELKELLTNECDLLYECKVCRNIFRSLINFLSHKRVYCKEKFCSSQHGHFMSNSSMMKEFLKIKRIEDGFQESLKAKDILLENLDEDERIPITKDLTAVLEGITKTKGQCVNVLDEVQQVTLQKIPNSSIAVFQSISSDEKNSDLMRSQVCELDAILSRDKAVLQSDGKFQVQSSTEAETEGVIQISDDDDTEVNGDVPRCKICNLQFSTQKTLKFHMKYKHVESRLVYPCPDCVDIFSTSWSVYRHLFKVHRKTAAQIRRLRESIQAKAFKMNNPPAFYEKRKNNMKSALETKKISEEEKLEQENQAWMASIESEGAPRCGGCGRTFERRAALHAHTHTCASRGRMLAHANLHAPAPLATYAAYAPRRPIQIQIRRDYGKETDSENKLPPDENAQSSFKQREPEPEKKELEEATMFVDEDSPTSNQSNKESVSESPEKSNDSLPEPPENKPTEPSSNTSENKLPNRPSFANQGDRINSNAVAFKQKFQTKGDADVQKLLCKICDFKYKTQQELCDHMATHCKWVRYSCKLCNCKEYFFNKISEHVKTVHKLKGDTDFYYSTVKVLDGNEALEIYEATVDAHEDNDTSPNSRRPSRCSSDSSRLSDDSSSSSVKIAGTTKKRKMKPSKIETKRKKECSLDNNDGNYDRKDGVTIDKVIHHVIFGDTETTTNNDKLFEENSSDLDEIEERLVKRMSNDVNRSSVAARRPVRKRTKPKNFNEDFEYDLSNLLKMEAQGYRESKDQVFTVKTIQTKKKIQIEASNTMDNINKDHIGALLNMSKKSVEFSAAHIKPFDMSIFNATKEPRVSHPFVKPMLPKIQSRSEKASPKKDSVEEKQYTIKTLESPEVNSEKDENPENETNRSLLKANASMIPMQFRRHSLDLIKNPIINKNISELSKAGMKTKILVIKPINRIKDGTKSVLKFQTIKLKENLKSSTDAKSDQVMLVKMPAVNVPTATNSIEEVETTPENNVIGDDEEIDIINDVYESTTKEDDENVNDKVIDQNDENESIDQGIVEEPSE